MIEDLELGKRLVEALAVGMRLDRPYIDQPTMTLLIREIERLSEQAILSQSQGLALLENLRLSTETLGKGYVPSIRKQSELWRWRFLRATTPAAADAYAEALRLAGIDPPEYLLE